MTLDERILSLIKRYMEKLFQKKVLTSMEEVEANTNETNLVAAPVVAELNNKLGEQPEWITDPATGKITGYKMGGADTVFPFIDEGKYVLKQILTVNANQYTYNMKNNGGNAFYAVQMDGKGFLLYPKRTSLGSAGTCNICNVNGGMANDDLSNVLINQDKITFTIPRPNYYTGNYIFIPIKL